MREQGVPVPLEVEGVAGGLQGTLEVLLVQEQLAELDLGLGLVGAQFHGLAEGLDGAVHPARLVPQDLGQEHPGLEVPGAQLDHPLGQILGLLEVLGDLLEGGRR